MERGRDQRIVPLIFSSQGTLNLIASFGVIWPVSLCSDLEKDFKVIEKDRVY